MDIVIKSIVFLPLLAAIFVGLQTRCLSAKTAQFITTLATMIAAVCAWTTLYHVIGNKEVYLLNISDWVVSGKFEAAWKIRVDALTAIMLTLVTTVSALVHLYSVGYMSHDEHPQRFMAYLSLFTFFMLVLVTSDNLLQLFVGWEGVGLCSYLLIGFWYKKPSANSAAMKAFIVNRVGDFALALGLVAIYHLFGTVSFNDIFANISSLKKETFEICGSEFNAITTICILLFIGCMGKSAQLGLHTWLPDAMEGPTPVSALIHAATMVTAGIFLVARMSPLFEVSEIARNMIVIVGGLTAIFAASIALTQNDIKKIIAYSTCSQLGYMFFACGVSAYGAGIFHLYTHGFFKALLFLGAGSVIHAMSDEQDIRNMGGIWKKIPFTYGVMIIGTLAITGFPFLSGYYSKDMILESTYAAYSAGNDFAGIAFALGITAAFFTAFYSWRLIILTFHGKCRADKETQDHIHESPLVMTIPLFILAVGALFVGYVFSAKLHITHAGLKFWNGAIAEGFVGKESIYKAAHHVPDWVITAPLVVGIVGFVLAVFFYVVAPKLPNALAKILSPLYKLSFNKYYIDEIYDAIFVRPVLKIARFFWKIIDTIFVDGLIPNGVAKVSLVSGRFMKSLQTGYVYHYSFLMLLGLIAAITYIIL